MKSISQKLIFENFADHPKGENHQKGTDDGKTTTSTHKNSTKPSKESSTNPTAGIDKLKKMLDPAESESRKQQIINERNNYNANFKGLDMNKAYQKLFEILWYTQLPCFDIKGITSKQKDETSILKRCYWKGHLTSCAEIFTAQPTDRGMCCTFNQEAADKIYHKSRYTQALKKMQEQDKSLSFKQENSEKPKNKVPLAGIKNGLELVLDAHRDLVTSSTVIDDFRGFITTVTSPNNFALTTKHSLMIKPGQSNAITISAVNVKASDQIRQLSVEARKCYFEDEFPLKMHKKYSHQNCILECTLDYAYEKVAEENGNYTKCVPWFYPVTDEQMNLCDPWEQKAFQKIFGAVPGNTCNHCLPDCKGNLFETKIDRAAFQKCDRTNLGASRFCDLEATDLNPSMWSQEVKDQFEAQTKSVPEYLIKDVKNKTKFSSRRYHEPDTKKRKTLALPHKNITYDAFENDIAMVTFYFESQSILQLERNVPMTSSNFISQVGGMLGFGLGFSFISLVEIIYWLTIRLGQNLSVKGRGKRFRNSTTNSK